MALEPWVATSEPEPVGSAPLRPNWLGTCDRMRERREPFRASDLRHLLAGGLAGLIVVLLLYNVINQAVAVLEGTNEQPTIEGTDGFAFDLVLNLLFFAIPPLVWVAALHGGVGGLRLRLGLRLDRLGRDLGWGIGLTLATVVGTILLLLGLQALGVSTENPAVEDLSREIPWALVPLLAVSAGIGEELFFRGLLQPRVGIVPANIFFGLVHLSYGTPLQVLVPLLLGFVYSWSFVRTRSLLPAILAHTLFNGSMLTLSKLVAPG